MELKEFNSKNSTRKMGSDQSTIHVDRKIGVICFSKKAVATMELADGDRVSFFQDSASPLDWYIKKNLPDGFPLRRSSSGSNLLFNSATLTNRILDSIREGKKWRSCSLLVQETAVKIDGRFYYLVLTACPHNVAMNQEL